jgi:hypothetical protein
MSGLEDIEATERAAIEPIEPDTCIPIIDANPETMAIAMGPRTWKQRRRFFDNIVNASMTASLKLAQKLEADECGLPLLQGVEISHLGIHQAIGEMIECLGEEEPACTDSAAVFLCSMNPAHHLAAREYLNASGHESAGCPPFMDQEVFPDGNPLVIFLRISITIRPGLSRYWRKLKADA